jgi:hypothetical protein
MEDNYSAASGVNQYVDDSEKKQDRNNSLRFNFEVETLNIKGTIKVKLMSEGFPKPQTLAEVDVPIFNLLECVNVTDEKGIYEMWFPLTLQNDLAIGDGELEKLYSSCAIEQNSHSQFGYKPCINLRFRWSNADNSAVDDSKMYGRLQIPAVTVAVIDSQRAIELLQISVIGV